jgi:hypothetical protein
MTVPCLRFRYFPDPISDCDFEHAKNHEKIKPVIRKQKSSAIVMKVLPCLRLFHSARTCRLNRTIVGVEIDLVSHRKL